MHVCFLWAEQKLIGRVAMSADDLISDLYPLGPLRKNCLRSGQGHHELRSAMKRRECITVIGGRTLARSG
jgi:hypothetical protein